MMNIQFKFHSKNKLSNLCASFKSTIVRLFYYRHRDTWLQHQDYKISGS